LHEIEKARDKGVLLIRYDADIGYMPSDLIITIDYSAIGRLQGEWLATRTRKGGNVIILSGSPSDAVAGKLHDSAMSVIKPEIDKGNLKVIMDKPVDDWNQEKVSGFIEDELGSQHIDTILAPNDGIASEVIQSLKRHSLCGKVFVCGMDGDLENCKSIIAGYQDMTIIKDWGDRVQAAMEASSEFCRGKKVAEMNISGKTVQDFIIYDKIKVPVFYVDAVIINKDNIGQLIDRNWYTKKELGL
jgi:D-xylose transport system substrate-binding protein